jgi:thiamine-phosphate pyrophosphorylase
MSSFQSLASRQPVLCYVTDRKALEAAGSHLLVESIRAAIDAGVDWIQIREKDLPARKLSALAGDAVRLAAELGRGTRILVNDRLDIAIAAGAAGVHLGGESVAVADAVRWCRGGNAPEGFLIGVSCHQIEDAREAERAGASYVFFGPVYDTPSKRDFGPAQGRGRLAGVCDGVRIPVIAIGGVTEENAAEAVEAGASGIAAIRLFQEPEDAASLKEGVDRLRKISRDARSRR